MKKLTLILLGLIFFATQASAQYSEEDAPQFKKLMESSVKLTVTMHYPSERIPVKTKKPNKDGTKTYIIEKRIFTVQGSGVIVGRIKSDDTYVYIVLTNKHLFQMQYKNKQLPLQDMKHCYTTFSFYGHEGYSSSKNSVSNYNIPWFGTLDAAVLMFTSKEIKPVAPLYNNMPRDLFGKPGVYIGYPYSRVHIGQGILGANCPYVHSKPYIIGFSGAFAIGCSGSGVYTKHNKNGSL